MSKDNKKTEKVESKESTIEKVKNVKKNIEENKPLRIIGNILYTLLFILIVIILLVVLLQRFSNNNISLGGYRMFNIVSESMIPKYVIGDIVLDKEIEPSEIKVGDDITYMGNSGDFKDRVVTHQVIGIENDENGEMIIHTKGIANDLEDPTIKADQVFGKVVYKFALLSLIGKITTDTVGFYLIIFIPIAILVALKIREIVVNMQEDDEDEEEDEEDEEERKERIKELQEEKQEREEKEKDKKAKKKSKKQEDNENEDEDEDNN